MKALPKIKAEQLHLQLYGKCFGRQRVIDPMNGCIAVSNAFNKSNVLASCLYLRSFAFRYSSILFNVFPRSNWSFITSLTSLRELTLHRCPDANLFERFPDEVVRWLANRESITLASTGAVLPLRIGKVLTHVVSCSQCISAESLMALAICCNIKHLEIEIERGAEHVQAHTVNRLSKLEVLHLEWRLFVSGYLEPSRGKILEAIQVALNIVELHLLYARIQLRELTDCDIRVYGR